MGSHHGHTALQTVVSQGEKTPRFLGFPAKSAVAITRKHRSPVRWVIRLRSVSTGEFFKKRLTKSELSKYNILNFGSSTKNTPIENKYCILTRPCGRLKGVKSISPVEAPNDAPRGPERLGTHQTPGISTEISGPSDGLFSTEGFQTMYDTESF